MIKSSKKYLSLFCLVISIIVIGITLLINMGISFSNDNGDSSMDINFYDVNVVVGQNNVASVTETISVSFASSMLVGEKHGIYRYIPYEVNASFVENESIVNRQYYVDITDVDANTNYEVFNEDGCMVIRLGDADTYVNNQTIIYEISYDYNMGYDRTEIEDFFYFNLIGTDWAIPISNATYSVTLPNDFDVSKVFVYYGQYGSDNLDHHSITGRTISGSISNLGAGEGITMKVNLPNDYFTVEKIKYGFDWLLVLVMIVVVVIILLLTCKNKRNTVLEIVEISPPSNLTPTDCAYYLNGSVRSKDLTALIVYWASKGYLKIKVERDNTTIIKIKNLQNAKSYEQTLFNNLFESGDSIILEQSANVFAKDYSTTMSQVSKSCNDGITRVDGSSYKQFGLALLFLFVPLLLLSVSYVVKLCIGYSNLENLLGIANYVIPLLILIVITAFSVAFTFGDLSKGIKEFCGKPITIINVALFIYFIIKMFSDRSLDKFGISIFIAILVALGLFMSAKLVFFKEAVGKKMGKIIGFKNFLSAVEKNRMEVLLKNDPSYFYDVLSYAYVMDIEDEFIEKFDSLLTTPPSWCETDTRQNFNGFFILHTLNQNLISFNNKIRAVSLASNIRSSGGSSFGGGGGGFSGGGFGGGGGGSW